MLRHSGQGEPGDTGGRKRKKISVNLQPNVEDMIDALEDSTGLRKSEVIQDAIKLFKFVRDEMEQGRRIYTVDQEGNNAREIVLL